MAHQFQVEGQLFDMQLFEQGQHIFALLRADEEVAVFDARGDALDRGGAAERELFNPVRELFQTDRCKDCHDENE
jgi:hypothetical protein